MEHQEENDILDFLIEWNHEETPEDWDDLGFSALMNSFDSSNSTRQPIIKDLTLWREPMESRSTSDAFPTPARDISMPEQSQALENPRGTISRRFRCVVWELENEAGLPHVGTCTGPSEMSMSDLLRHLRRSHFYVEACPACNQNIYDEEEFRTKHGKRRQNWCTGSARQRRGKELESSYLVLLETVRSIHPSLWNMSEGQRNKEQNSSRAMVNTSGDLNSQLGNHIVLQSLQNQPLEWNTKGSNKHSERAGCRHQETDTRCPYHWNANTDRWSAAVSRVESPYLGSHIPGHRQTTDDQNPELLRKQDGQTDQRTTRGAASFNLPLPYGQLSINASTANAYSSGTYLIPSIIAPPELPMSNASILRTSAPSELRVGPRQGPGDEVLHCPYNCGTVLSGVHAAGNLTRHLKSQTCTGSTKAKEKYVCPVEDCHKDYTRSDGLRVHMRRRHGEMRSGYSPPPQGDYTYY